MGLDERAVEAVQRWLFRPAYRDGRPTAAVAIVEVNFRLL
jgi:outer membrane biosynthesis protein TonB